MNNNDLSKEVMLPLYETVLNLLDRYGKGRADVTDLTKQVRSMLGIQPPASKQNAPTKTIESNDA